MPEHRWISLCCGLAATECRAMTGRFPPVARMGGKRAVADGVLDILGSWPKRWLLVDADLAIVEFWQAAFAGLLPAVAEVIRNAPVDGEELWRLWTSEPVPADPVERVARWIVAQKGNFSAKPLSYDASAWLGSPSFGTYTGEQRPAAIAKGFKSEHAILKKDRVAATLAAWKGVAGCAAHERTSAKWKPRPEHRVELTAGDVERWSGVAGWNDPGESARQAGFPERCRREPVAEKVERWSGVAGFAALSPLAHRKGFRDRFTGEKLARATDLPMPVGEALFLDLATSSPIVRPGDLVTIDPPYQGTSGYGSALPRARVVELAQEAHERGARVLVHEAEPVIEGGSWRSLELHRTRGKGQRTWSKQKAEWVTINFEPATAHPGAAKDRAASRREMAPISGPLFEA